MEDFALIKSHVNLNRVDLGIALISDLKVLSRFFNFPLLPHLIAAVIETSNHTKAKGILKMISS